MTLHHIAWALVAVVGSSCATSRGVAGASPGRCGPRAGTAAPLELVVLGSGGPRSFGRAGSSYAVLTAGQPRLLVDVGPGASVTFGEMGLNYDRLDTVLLTHLHIDHAGDLPGLLKSWDLTYSGRPLAVKVVGPDGSGEYPATTELVDALFGAGGAFRYLRTFRNPLELAVTAVPVASAAAPVVVPGPDGLRVQAIAVDHGEVPALAYRIEADGRSIVVSGDLGSTSDALATLAADADVLVYDTAVLDPPAAPPQLYALHTAPARIGEVAARARVKRLVLGHVTPPVEKNPRAVVDSIRASYAGPVELAEDCLRVPVP